MFLFWGELDEVIGIEHIDSIRRQVVFVIDDANMRLVVCTLVAICLGACFRSPASEFILKGREMAKRKDFIRAIEAYDDALRSEPKNMEAYYFRGFAKYEIKDYEGAMEDLTLLVKSGIRIERDKYQYVFNTRGIANYFLGNNEAALRDYSAAISINPNFTDAYGNRGDVRMLLGDASGAIADYDFAIAVEPEDLDLYNNRGVARYQLNDTTGACGDWARAVELGSGEAKVSWDKHCK
ncbi:tetratricopeptide repeat protein [Persicitalea jodogahamensis]|uniref:Tetratricopeptide repeat protein n=1 Tax=Persicitalea jodogahamensis TaxID=402147 RepID=A0A8J3G7B7_9BACT|nr:tetratricopeptide repeat protein [Persicitalea jodogahamensis]GHB54495.1 hypothetical protein GCM10007390_04410 [Persicitalea jodogahamensis]